MTALTPEALSTIAVAAAVVALLALLLAVVALRRAGALAAHYNLLMEGVEGTDMGAALEVLARRVGALEQASAAADLRAVALDSGLSGAVQRVRMLRYNAFGDSGGDQSFAVALLDRGGSGVVMSSLHGRDGVRMYAKPVRDGRSEYTLSEEEARVVTEAMAS